MIELAGGKENLSISLEEEFSNDEEAFLERNKLRSSDPDSITGPSNYPPDVFKRSKEKFPEKHANSKTKDIKL